MIRLVSLISLLITTFAFGDTENPEPPKDLKAIAMAGGDIVLTWKDTSNVETGFRVERRKSGDDAFTHVGDLSTGVYTFGILALQRQRNITIAFAPLAGRATLIFQI